MPAAIGASGPTTTKSTALRLAERITAAWSVISSADAFGLLGDAGIARRAAEPCHQGGCGDLPGQRMFAAAGTDQENVH